MTISGYVPFYNNAATVVAAVESLKRQTTPLDEVFAVDDGSTDHGAELLEAAGVRVIRMGANYGRGAVRARAMREATGDLVLCCDATNALDPNFVERAIPWFNAPQMAAVVGRIGQSNPSTAVERWRARHLFKSHVIFSVEHGSVLNTFGAVVRSSHARQVGDFDVRLRHSEDADLGYRLAASGFDIVMDPSLRIDSIARNTLHEVLERYWRWYAGKNEILSLVAFLQISWYSLRTMSAMDLARRDLAAALISAYYPVFLAVKSLCRRMSGRRQNVR